MQPRVVELHPRDDHRARRRGRALSGKGTSTAGGGSVESDPFTLARQNRRNGDKPKLPTWQAVQAALASSRD
jgi:hypothetical protein